MMVDACVNRSEFYMMMEETKDKAAQKAEKQAALNGGTGSCLSH